MTTDNSETADVSDVKKSVHFNRFPNFGTSVITLIYLPIGLALGVIRLFIFLHACLVFFLLPNKFPLKRWILRIMLSVTGIFTSSQGDSGRIDDKAKVLIANHVSSLDPFLLYLVCPNILVIECSDLGAKSKAFQRYKVPEGKDKAEVILSLKKCIAGNDDPVLFFPERMRTNGTYWLLKFSLLPFDLGHPLQPVTIQLSRYPFDVNISTFFSSVYEDLFWCLVLPFTLFKIKFLPISERKKDESCEEFSSRVHANMTKSLGLRKTSLSHSDIMEFVKKRTNTNDEPALKPQLYRPKQTDKANQPADSSLDPELQRMLLQVRDVLPDTPQAYILMELSKTRDVDATITNILEGNAGSSPSSSEEKPMISLTSQSPEGLSFKASKFEATARGRHLSYQERKQAMIETARLKYRIKHGL